MSEYIIECSKNLYSKEVLFRTAYTLLENYYFFIDENEKYFLIEISSKNKNKDLETMKKEFYDELIETQATLDQLKRTSKIREELFERALLTQSLQEEINGGIKK